MRAIAIIVIIGVFYSGMFYRWEVMLELAISLNLYLSVIPPSAEDLSISLSRPLKILTSIKKKLATNILHKQTLKSALLLSLVGVGIGWLTVIGQLLWDFTYQILYSELQESILDLIIFTFLSPLIKHQFDLITDQAEKAERKICYVESYVEHPNYEFDETRYSSSFDMANLYNANLEYEAELTEIIATFKRRALLSFLVAAILFLTGVSLTLWF